MGEQGATCLVPRQDGRANGRSTCDLHPHQTLAQIGLVLHPRGHFLPDIAAFAKIDAVQPLKPRFQQVAVIRDQLDPCFGNAMRHPDGIPVDQRRAARNAVAAPAKRRVAWVGKGSGRSGAKPARDRKVSGRDLHIGAQAVHHQAPLRAVGNVGFDVDQQSVGRGHHKEIGKILALRGQQRRPDDARRLSKGQHVVAEHALQKGQAVSAGHLQHGAVRGGFTGHGNTPSGCCVSLNCNR